MVGLHVKVCDEAVWTVQQGPHRFRQRGAGVHGGQGVHQARRHVLGQEGGRLLAAVAVKNAKQRKPCLACGRERQAV